MLCQIERAGAHYQEIWCSRSCILARFAAFLGLGLGVRGGGVESFYNNFSA